MGIEALRTPDDRFQNLPDFPYGAAYEEDLPGFAGLRMARVDEGAGERTVLMLHGEPTWSFLYRKMIPVFLEAGHRCVAPDFFGFGRSDKPVDDDVYGYEFHRRSLLALVERLDLRRVTLVVQDWGGILGLTLPLEHADRIERVIVMNTALPTGGSPGQGFLDWQAYVESSPDLDVGRLMKRAAPRLTDAEAAAYDAPFPSASHKAGVRTFPRLVPITPGMPGVETSKKALAFWRERFEGQSFMAVGAKDPVLGAPVMEALRQHIRGCPPALVLEDEGHFVQESGEVVARAALEAFGP